jgi:hypothetical protein
MDLSHRQYFDLIIDSNDSAIANKRLDVYIKYTYGLSSAPVESRLIPTVDFPIYYNTTTQLLNSAAKYEKFNFDIDLSRDLILSTGGLLSIPLNSNRSLISNHFGKGGDTLMLENFNIGTSSQSDFSGQYKITSVGATNSYILLQIIYFQMFHISNTTKVSNIGLQG